MPRYFLELSYKGTRYSGFQVQENTITVQSAVEAALRTLYKQPFALTGSSRTDSGVHARQNFFHFDTELPLLQKEIYNLNAILPADIAAAAFYRVADDAHSRFGAISREYKYYIYRKKDPFMDDRAWYYPYTIDEDILRNLAQLVQNQLDFTAFSKRNTQVNTFNCRILVSEWVWKAGYLVYHVEGSRFLRGMVRALVSTMLKAARGSISAEAFIQLLQDGVQSSADFSAPAHGLFLEAVKYPENYMVMIE